MDTAVTIALNETIPIEASPCPFRVRTKSPILPQSMPASNIRNGAAFFKLSTSHDYEFVYNSVKICIYLT